jgi:hypothetical protein
VNTFDDGQTIPQLELLVARACNPSTQEARVQGQPGLPTGLKTIRKAVKKKKKLDFYLTIESER